MTKAIRPAGLYGLVGGMLLLVLGGVGYWLWQRKTPEPARQGIFREEAEEAGLDFRMVFLEGEQGANFKINLYDHGCGVAVGDYDGDGHDDIYLLNQLGTNALYRNKGDGTFEETSARAGVALGDRICVAAVFADYDNDGRQDLFVTSTRGGNVLFHNDGDGKFRDVTAEAGLTLKRHCQSAHFFDFNRDGHLDLLVTCTAKWTETALHPRLHYYPGKASYFATAGSEKEHNVLYRNDGKGTFVDVTEAAGLKGLGWAADAAVFDFDDDGHLDVVVTNMFGRAQLYRNQGNSTFVEVTREILGRTSWGGMGVRAFDFNNDGRLDLYMVDMHSDMWLPADTDLSVVEPHTKNRYVGGPFTESDPRFARLLNEEKQFADLVKLRYEEVHFGNTFFKNLGQGKFEEMSEKANLETFWPWGIASGDFDNDGYEDLFLPGGMGYPFEYWPNSLLVNDGKESFSDRAREYNLEPPAKGIYQDKEIGGKPATRSSRAAATADFDGDGRLDLIVNNFNGRVSYFRNRGKGGHYLALRLRGTKSNRDAIGAVVRLTVGTEVLTRQVHSATGYLSQSSRTLHFGLGDRKKIDRVEITWPSGKRQVVDAPKLNGRHDIVEPEL